MNRIGHARVTLVIAGWSGVCLLPGAPADEAGKLMTDKVIYELRACAFRPNVNVDESTLQFGCPAVTEVRDELPPWDWWLSPITPGVRNICGRTRSEEICVCGTAVESAFSLERSAAGRPLVQAIQHTEEGVEL